MADKTVVFSKMSGEQAVRVTVRIDWLADGTIIPRLYWTPDGSCYEVRHIYECIPLAVLKDGGEGLRFRVRADNTESPAPDSDSLYLRQETYLYFADKLFCERNIVDGRYVHARKEYVPVTLDVFPDGGYELAHFWVRGERYIVEKTIEIDARGSYHAGGVGIWHKVEVRLVNADDDENPDPAKSVRRLSALYLELNKWFVTVKAA